VDRRTRLFFALILIGVIAIAGGAALLSQRSAGARPDGSPTVDGIVISVDSQGLGNVKGFRLRTADGRVLTFDLSGDRNGAQFPPGHLTEHLATAAPIRVWYAGSGDQLKALWLEDAPAT
jgi:hypothetical protein